MIALLMATGKWPAEKPRVWADYEAWGLSESSLKIDASNASKLNKRVYTDDEIKEHMTEFLQDNAQLAKADGQFSAASQSLRVLSEARGLLKNEHTLNVRKMKDQELDAEMLQLVDAMGYKLVPKDEGE